MKQALRKPLLPLSLFLLGCVVGGSLVYAKTHASVAKRTVTVNGYALVRTPADSASIYADVISSGQDKEQVRAENKRAAERLKQALVAKGISESTVNVYQYEPQQGGYDISTTPAPNAAYVGKTQFTIRIAKDKLGKVTEYMKVINDLPFTANVTSSFELKDVVSSKNKAREKALLDARQQAEKIAQINKERVDEVLSIKDLESQNVTPYFYDDQAEVTASYEVKYELD